MSDREKKLNVLLKDFGYRFEGNLLIRNKVGFLPEKVIRRFKDISGAVEYLVPIINDWEYSRRIN